MTRLDLEWMAGGLQVPCVTVGTEGLELNRAAERALSHGAEPDSLIAALSVIIGEGPDLSKLEALRRKELRNGWRSGVNEPSGNPGVRSRCCRRPGAQKQKLHAP